VVSVIVAALALCGPWMAGAQPPPLPVPMPRLDDLETAVADQIRDAHREALEVVAKKGASRDAANAYGSLARVYHAYEFFDSAEPAYVNASRLASGNSEWFHLLGALYQQTGRLEDAARAFTTARRLQPRDHAAAIYLGDIYIGLNRLLDARELFQSVVDTYPAVARRGLGDVALRERRYAEAVEHYLAVLDRVPQADAIHYSLAMAYRGMGRLDRARAHLDRRGPGGVHAADPLLDALQTLVRGERALVIQGRRAYEAGEFQSALDAFTRALEAAPSSVTARVNVASALIQLRRDADAIGYLRDALRASPREAGVAETLIGALLRLGRGDEAIETFLRTPSYRPEDEDSLVGLSILLADRQRFREAISLLNEAHQRVPDRTATATTLARLLAAAPDVSLRDGRRALEIATAVNDADPSPAHAETIALALAELGRCEEALTWMRRAVAEAERAGDAAQARRLESEIPKYLEAPCRPLGEEPAGRRSNPRGL
jgi:tetratricopeptide (TPR) repeat protein